MIICGTLLGLVIGFGISFFIARQQLKTRTQRQLHLRDALCQWAYAYKKQKPNVNSPEHYLLDAVHRVGTSNIHRHDMW